MRLRGQIERKRQQEEGDSPRNSAWPFINCIIKIAAFILTIILIIILTLSQEKLTGWYHGFDVLGLILHSSLPSFAMISSWAKCGSPLVEFGLDHVTCFGHSIWAEATICPALGLSGRAIFPLVPLHFCHCLRRVSSTGDFLTNFSLSPKNEYTGARAALVHNAQN